MKRVEREPSRVSTLLLALRVPPRSTAVTIVTARDDTMPVCSVCYLFRQVPCLDGGQLGRVCSVSFIMCRVRVPLSPIIMSCAAGCPWGTDVTIIFECEDGRRGAAIIHG